MKARIFSKGDNSVGISGMEGSIDLGMDIEDEDREGFRADIASYFSAMWDDPATVFFEDEEFDD